MSANPPPVGFTEEQLDDQIMRVVKAEYFPLNPPSINLGGGQRNDENATATLSIEPRSQGSKPA